jgi:hypothetical protein
MSRLAALCCLLALSGLLVLGQAAPDTAPPPGGDVKIKVPPLPARLAATVKFAGLDEGVTLEDALDHLAKTYDLTFDVDEEGFKAEGVDKVLEQGLTGKGLKKRDKVRLDALLRKVLARLVVPSGATYVLRRGGIEVTTNAAARSRIWGHHTGPFLPLVHATFEKRPLEEALKELAEQAEYNIVLDGRVGEKAREAVTGRFLNTPLDTAVGFLADAADLRTVLQDNVVYVTTKENAALWESKQKGSPGDPEAGPRVGPGVGAPLAPSAPMGM